MKRLVVATLAFAAFAASASAQDYPTRNITFIVPFPAGGPSDIVARIAAEAHAEASRPEHRDRKRRRRRRHDRRDARGRGQSGRLHVVRRQHGHHHRGADFYPNFKYNSNKDFEPIGMSANAPAALARQQQRAGQGHEGVHRLGQGKGVDVKQAHGGVGGTSHMACLMVNRLPASSRPRLPIAAWAPA